MVFLLVNVGYHIGLSNEATCRKLKLKILHPVFVSDCFKNGLHLSTGFACNIAICQNVVQMEETMKSSCDLPQPLLGQAFSDSAFAGPVLLSSMFYFFNVWTPKMILLWRLNALTSGSSFHGLLPNSPYIYIFIYIYISNIDILVHCLVLSSTVFLFVCFCDINFMFL